MNPAPLEAVRDNQTHPDADTLTHTTSQTHRNAHIQYGGTCAEITVLPELDTACNTTCSATKHAHQDIHLLCVHA